MSTSLEDLEKQLLFEELKSNWSKVKLLKSSIARRKLIDAIKAEHDIDEGWITQKLKEGSRI